MAVLHAILTKAVWLCCGGGGLAEYDGKMKRNDENMVMRRNCLFVDDVLMILLVEKEMEEKEEREGKYKKTKVREKYYKRNYLYNSGFVG